MIPRQIRPRLKWLASIFAVLSIGACSGGDSDSGIDNASIAQATAVLNAPIFVTTEKGLWAEEQLKVSVKPFAAGRLALDSLLAGEVQIATIADTPVAYALPNNPDLRILATIMKSPTDIKMVARKSAGIESRADLAGKRIGVFRGTAGEYFLNRFLETSGIPADSVKIVNVRPPDMVAGIVAGDIDAYAVWEPHAQNGLLKLGDDSITFIDESVYTETWNLVTRANVIEESPEVLARMVSAVVNGVDYLNANPEEAKAITAKATGINRDTLDSIWGSYVFSVSLEQTLADSIRRQLDWIAGQNDRGTGRENVDVSKVLYPGFLLEIRPSAVVN